MRVALCQMTAGIEAAANAETIVAALASARGAGATMLFTPEMSLLLDRDRNRASTSIHPETDDPHLSRLVDATRDAGLWLMLGSVAVRGTGTRHANRSLAVSPDGRIVARYDKMHLFDVAVGAADTWRESDGYVPGDAAVIVETSGANVGLSICYDVRFPALYQALSAGGATILAIPAAFTRPTGAAHWETLLRARAIENACFVVAAAQTGNHADGRTTHGHSMVIDAWGTILLDMGEAPGVAVVDLPMERIADARGRIPVIAHRRSIDRLVTAP